jgi:hypothetical protein
MLAAGAALTGRNSFKAFREAIHPDLKWNDDADAPASAPRSGIQTGSRRPSSRRKKDIENAKSFAYLLGIRQANAPQLSLSLFGPVWLHAPFSQRATCPPSAFVRQLSSAITTRLGVRPPRACEPRPIGVPIRASPSMIGQATQGCRIPPPRTPPTSFYRYFIDRMQSDERPPRALGMTRWAHTY